MLPQIWLAEAKPHFAIDPSLTVSRRPSTIGGSHPPITV